MANTISPFGAADFQHQGGSQRTEELRQVWIFSSYATPIFNGDICCDATPVSTGLQNSGFGAYITQGCSQTAGNYVGVFRGCELYNTALQKMYYSRYWPGQSAAGTSSQTGDVKAYIQADEKQLFTIQTSSLGGVLGSSNIGNLFAVSVNGTVNAASTAANGGNTTTGNSGMQIASTSATALSSTTGTGTAGFGLPFQLIDFYSNWGPGLLPGMVPGLGTTQFVNGMDNTSQGQIVIVRAFNWAG